MCCRVLAIKGTEIRCNFNEECVEPKMCGTNGFILTDPEGSEARDPMAKQQLGPFGMVRRYIMYVFIVQRPFESNLSNSALLRLYLLCVRLKRAIHISLKSLPLINTTLVVLLQSFTGASMLI